MSQMTTAENETGQCEPASTQVASDWVSFWNSEHSIYVNQRHFNVHYRDIADGIATLLPHAEARLLDYGCGEALHADRVALAAAEVLLCESASTVRARLTTRFAGESRIKVLAPEDLEQHPDESLDLVVANSMVQYLSDVELNRVLALWRRLLAPAGVLVVGDVIPPNVGALNDVLALLRYAARNGFFLAAVSGLFRTLFSPYRRLRSRLGIATYRATEFLDKLSAAGFTGERLPFNLEHNPARMTFRAVKRPQPLPVRDQAASRLSRLEA
jgi:SAM-dependent methyltransferase